MTHHENQIIMSPDYKILGDLAAREGKLQLAEQCYRKIAELEPYNRNIHYGIGEFLFRTERYTEAIKEFHIALGSEIIIPEIYAYLGYAYLANDQPGKAEEYYRKALELTPDNPHVHLGLGAIAHAHRKNEEAKQHYQKALELDPACEEARKYLRHLESNLGY